MDAVSAHTPREASGMIRPLIADTVHYVSLGSENGEYPRACVAAIVTGTYPDEPGSDDCIIGLRAFPMWGETIRDHVIHDDGEPHPDAVLTCRRRDYPPGTWHWAQ
jgi:hypothetical protein